MHYSETHEWITTQGDIGTVGISNHAQKELGDIVYVELPQVGRVVKAGEEVAVVESTKAASDVYSPVSGKILGVNEALKEHPDWINHSAEEKGWIFRVQLSNPQEIEQLQDAQTYNRSFS